MRYSLHIDGSMPWTAFAEAASVRLGEAVHWKDVFFEQTGISQDVLKDCEIYGFVPKKIWRKLKILSTASNEIGSALWIAREMDFVLKNKKSVQST